MFPDGRLMDRRSIVIIDDHPIFRSGLVQTLELDPALEVVAQGDSGTDAVRLAAEHRPDMMLLDVTMQSGGIDAVPDIIRTSPNTLVVMLTASENAKDVSRSLDLGAVSYLLKGATASELLASINAILRGSIEISPRLLGDLFNHQQVHAQTADQEAIARLTSQELKVLRLVSQGLSNAEIGRTLDVQEKTIKFHLSNIFDKLEVRNRVEAAILGQRAWDNQNR